MRRLRGLKILAVTAVLAGFSVCSLFAQTFGEVTGRVTDPSGAVIPGASVTLTNVNNNAVRNVVTTEAGAYTFPSIAPGLYRLRAELAGFKAAWARSAKRSKLPLPLSCCNPRLQPSARWSRTRSSPTCP
jgi:hypothetical protein